MKCAILADIHGNSAALSAVLADMSNLGVQEAVNLGDHFSGPLDATGTAKILMPLNFPSIRGNHDRYLLDQKPAVMGPSDRVAFDQLKHEHLAWLADLPATLEVFGDVFLCHGTPQSDETYWLERVTGEGGIRQASLTEIEAEANDIAAGLILCGHTHFPRISRLRDGRIVLNPGSIGCPAYDDTTPVYHQMQTGTPNASYAIAEKVGPQWDITFRSVPYDAEAMALLAERHGRPDWAQGLRTGWLTP